MSEYNKLLEQELKKRAGITKNPVAMIDAPESTKEVRKLSKIDVTK
jgi:hypothetical protein